MSILQPLLHLELGLTDMLIHAQVGTDSVPGDQGCDVSLHFYLDNCRLQVSPTASDADPVLHFLQVISWCSTSRWPPVRCER